MIYPGKRCMCFRQECIFCCGVLGGVFCRRLLGLLVLYVFQTYYFLVVPSTIESVIIVSNYYYYYWIVIHLYKELVRQTDFQTDLGSKRLWNKSREFSLSQTDQRHLHFFLPCCTYSLLSKSSNPNPRSIHLIRAGIDASDVPKGSNVLV